MRKRSRRESAVMLAAASILVGLGSLSGCNRAAENARPASSAGEPAPAELALTSKLLDFKGEETECPAFVDSLEAVSKLHGWHNDFLDLQKLAFTEWTRGRAVKLQSGGSEFVVVVLDHESCSIPGENVKLVILLDDQGRLKDHVACTISNRNCMYGGRFDAEFPAKPGPEDPHIVIRLNNESARGNFAHKLTHRGQSRSFYWGEYDVFGTEPTKWDLKGLCQLAIRDGQFHIMFPTDMDMVAR